MKKKIFLLIWLASLLSAAAYLFWREDWQYLLPTPVPENHVSVVPGQEIMLPEELKNPSRPLFLHFFNPDCACSQFNIPHFVTLVNSYADQIDFRVVAMTDKLYTEADIQNKFNLEVPVIFSKELSSSCGVYSTPQAALIETGQKLYYRGNYNRSRFCTDRETNYAQIAIDSLLEQKNIHPEAAATTSYGCSLPDCKKFD